MNGVNMDTTKILTEKLSLARELATLKPELEHLRSQAAYQQTVLAEKLALQRQVSTLEVELETEKRASKRAAAKNDSKDGEMELQSQLEAVQKDMARQRKEAVKVLKEKEADLQNELETLQKELVREKKLNGKAQHEREADLQNQVESLQKDLARAKKEGGKAKTDREEELQEQLEASQKDLAREKREATKAQKEVEKELKAAESRHTILESKLDQVKTKLRETKEQLKECQTELSQARAAATKTAGKGAGTDGPTKNPRKRSALEMSTDVNIGTPDGVAVRGKRPAVKRGGKDQTLVGEKSMFSITPFLNKTVNMALDTPDKKTIHDITEEEETSEHQVPLETGKEARPETLAAPDHSSPLPAVKTKAKISDKPAAVDKKVLKESKTNSQNKKAMPQKRPISTLEKVTEEDADENEEPCPVAPEAAAPKISTARKAGPVKPVNLQTKPSDATEAGPTKKKRKLLGGKTLFDEDDREATKRPTKVNLGAPRLLGKGGLAGPAGGLKSGLGAAGFGAFSPLKKDRRGVGASFLA